MQKKNDDEAFAAGRDLKSTIRSNIQNEEEDSKADASAKKIFRYKGVLSVLLKLCVREYKVFTIWICINDIPKHLQNTVIRYKMTATQAYGVVCEKAPDADLMEMIMIRLGGGMDEMSAPEVVKYLYGIFEYGRHGKHFDRYIAMKETEKEEMQEIREELNKMGGIELLNYREGLNDGIAKGFNDGITKGKIQALYHDAGFTVEKIAEKLGQEVGFVKEVLDEETMTE